LPFLSIFDPFHENLDITYYEYNKYNNIYYKEGLFEDYKKDEFINCYNIIKLLKEKLNDKLILILGNHDIRYYKDIDLTEIDNLTEEIYNYLKFINNNFVLYYNIYNKIYCNHYYKFNYRHKIKIFDENDNINNLNEINNLIKIKKYLLNLSNKIQDIKIKNIKKDKIINKNNDRFKYIYIKGHETNIDYILLKKIIYLDNRMSKFKYNLSKCLLNNCYNLYLHIFKQDNNIIINKINNYKIIYKLIINKDDNYKINFLNNYYLKNITDNKKENLNNNIKQILLNDKNNLNNEIEKLNINKYKFINQDILNKICIMNEKLNFIYNINNYNNIKLYMDQDNYTYIYNENLDIIGNIYLKENYINMIEGEKILINDIKNNYKILYDNEKNKIIKGSYDYKLYIPQCIKNYNYITSFLKIYNNLKDKNHLLLIKQLFIMFYNYNLTDKIFYDNFDKCFKNYNNLKSPEDNLYIQIYNIEYAIETLESDKIGFKDLLDIIIYISSELCEINDMVNYKLIELCYKIINKKDFKKKLNLIIKLTNKLKYFNNQKEKPIFIINNMTENYEDKFNDDNFELKYITQLNIYALYYIYNLNLYDELNKEIKFLLNLNN